MWKRLVGMAVVVGLTTVAWGQVPRDPDRPATREGAPAAREGAAPAREGQYQTQNASADQQFAAIKLAYCRNEVELAKLAQQKAQSEEVKQFAASEAREHAAACERLEKWAGDLAVSYREGPGEGRATDRPAADRPGAQRREERREDRPGARPGADEPKPRPPAGAEGREVEVRVAPGTRPAAEVAIRAGDRGGNLNWVAIHQQLAQQCLASAKKELNQKEGAEFDKCYVAMTIGAHQHAIDADKVFQSYASQQFQGELQRCAETAAAHLQEAKNVCKQLDGNTDRAARKPE